MGGVAGGRVDEPHHLLAALSMVRGRYGWELCLAAATHWYERGRISQERAAQVAGLSRAQFLEALSRTKSDAFVVDFEDLKRELKHGAER